MEKQLEQVRKDLLSTQAQLDTPSMLGSTSHEQKKLLEGEHTQRLKLLDELRAVNKENASLRKQLANSNVASMANVANVAHSMANYRPSGIGPKKQLTRTNALAYSP